MSEREVTRSHFSRLLLEQAALAISIAIGFVDRLVVSALLLKLWGVSPFEAWSVCAAWAGLAGLFEFGFNMYFNNTLMIEVERGRMDAAARLYFISNTIFVTAAVAAVGAAAVVVSSGRVDAAIGPASFILALGTALRVASNGTSALYRANREYGRHVLIQCAGESLRILAIVVAVALGAGLLGAAVASTAAVAVVLVGFVSFDALRRFAPGRFGFALPDRNELRAIMAMSTAFFAQNVPILLLTALPVLYLQSLDVKTGMLATFVLIRTMTGLPRTLIQSFTIALGQEGGRRLAINDHAGALVVCRESGRLISVISGAAIGLLLGAGNAFMILWTGSADHYEPSYVVAALLPVALAALSVFAHNFLISSNAPYLAAIGRWMQALVTVAFVIARPTGDAVLDMFLALSLGELLGYIPFAYWALARMIPGTGIAFHLRQIVATLLAGAFVMGAARALISLAGDQSKLALLAGFTASAAVCVLAVLLFGLSHSRQVALLDRLVRVARFGVGRVEH